MLDLKMNLGGDYVDGEGDDIIAIVKGDFAIRNGKFMLVPEDDLAAQVGQRLHVRLHLRRGEVFFNSQAGFPYADMSKFKRGSNIFNGYMKSYIVATDGISQLTRYTSSLDKITRKQTVDFDVLVSNGQAVTSTQEVDV